MTIIDTTFDTVAGRDDDGTEYIAIPVYEDSVISLYRLPTGGAAKIAGLRSIPDDAEPVDTYDFDDCSDAVAVYHKCESLILALESKMYRDTVSKLNWPYPVSVLNMIHVCKGDECPHFVKLFAGGSCMMGLPEQTDSGKQLCTVYGNKDSDVQ